MDSHSRSASPRERPLHRPPSPPDSPTAFDNQGFQHEEDPNHNESFTSSASQKNGTNGHVKNDVKTLEAVNLELINMTPKKKEVDADATNPYDEYFVPVNEHRKYMRGEKLYVTADKRSDKGGCKRSLCWTLLGLVVVAIVVLIVLAATGILFSNTPTTLEQYNSSISSARALGGIGIPQRNVEFTQPEQHRHDHTEQDHSQHENSIDNQSQYYPRNNIQGTPQSQGPETDFPSTSPDLGDNPPMYVPQTVEGEIKIDNEEFSEVLQDPENDGYKEFATDFTAALRSALFSRNTLKNNSVQINVQVVQIRRGSIIITYRVHWNSKANQYDMRDFLTPTKLKSLLNSYLDKNNRMISIYHIAEDKITTRLVLDNCQINKNDCEYGCKFDESTLDFICTCPASYILDMDNQKKCVHLLENTGDSEQTLRQISVLSIDNSSKTATSDMDSVPTLKPTTEIIMETTTEADMDLFLSHIMSDHQNKSEKSEKKGVAEPTPEPVQEPTPEPTPEPTLEPDMEHYVVNIGSAQEPTPEPTQEPTPEPVQEPTPEPIQEPSPEPTQEPTPEPAQKPEPSQEPMPKPSNEPAEEPTPEPTQEPTAEPAQQPTPESTHKPTPLPAQKPTLAVTQQQTPADESEPTAEPVRDPTPDHSEDANSLSVDVDTPSSTTGKSSSVEKYSTTPITIADIILASNAQPISETAVESMGQNVLPLTTAPTSESPPIESYIMTIGPITDATSEPRTNVKEHSLESKSKQPKQLKPISLEKIIANENTEATSDSPTTDSSINDQNTTPDTMVELDMEFKTLLGESASENDVPQNSEVDYLSNTKAGNERLPHKQINENDEKINNILLEDLNKMLTKTTAQLPSTTTQLIDMTELTTNNDIETTTISEWIQHSFEENKLVTNNEKSINDIFDKNDTSSDNDTLKTLSTSSTKDATSVTNINNSSTSVLTDSKEDNETSLIIESLNMYNLTSKEEEVTTVTFNPINIETSGELYNTIQNQEDPTTLIPIKKPLENNTVSQIQITLESQNQTALKSLQTTTSLPISIFKSKIETENEKTKKANQLDIINDKLKKQKTSYKSKLDNIPTYYSKDGQTTTTDSDWLTESVIEVKYDDKMNAGDQPNIAEKENLPKTDNVNDFEHYYKLSSGATPKFKQNYDSLYSLIDYDSPDAPAKREFVNSVSEANPTVNIMISNEIPNNSQVNHTELQSLAESTTVVEYIYKNTEKITKDADLPNTTPMVTAEEPAPVWEVREPETNSSTDNAHSMIENNFTSVQLTSPQPLPSQDVKIAEITPQSYLSPNTLLNVPENTDASLNSSNVTHLNNLNVTIYEISNQNNPTSKSPTSQTLEYEDHESEMNPFLPEVENNKSLVKKLQEGHDIEPINVNETQNENLDDGHNLSIYNSTINKSSDIPKIHAASKDELNNEVNNTDPSMNNVNKIEFKSSAGTKPSDHGAVPDFLKDTEDLDINQIHTTSSVLTTSDDISITEESSTSLSELTAVTENNDLNVVPLEHKSDHIIN